MDLLNGFVCGNTVDISRIIHDHPKGTLTEIYGMEISTKVNKLFFTNKWGIT